MSIPREPIRLVSHNAENTSKTNNDEIRVMGVRTPTLDVTDALNDFCDEHIDSLSDLDGYILMQKSPSCGLERVKVYNSSGQTIHHEGIGVFAKRLRDQYPLMPIEEIGRLNDSNLRENFFTRVYLYKYWKQFVNDGLTASALIQFHSQIKLLLLSHHQAHYRQLGRKVANLKGTALPEIAHDYISHLMTALNTIATRRNHANVLLHASGHFRKSLSKENRQELAHLIHDYRKAILPLSAPITLIKHHLRNHPTPYLSQQFYWQPHPDALKFRNFI